jgi:hypothetical protein
MPDSDRVAALKVAFGLHEAAGDLRLRCGEDRAVTIARDETAIRDSAEVFLAWLRGTVRIRLYAGSATDQTTGQPTGTPTEGVPVQIHDNEQFTLTVDTKDAKGFETPDAVTWTSSDETVATITVSDDTRTATIVAGSPGSAVVTVTDGELSATEAVDVVPAGTATISVVEGPVTAQP